MSDYQGEERRRDMKQAMKEAIREFLDEKFSQFGKWSMAAFAALAVAALTYFILWANGYHR